MKLFTRTLFWFAVLCMVIQGDTARAVNPVRLMLDLSDRPDAVMLSAFDLCIVKVDAQVDLEAQQTLGNKMLARVNLFEVGENSVAARTAASIGVPLLEGAEKGQVRLDATHPNWVPLVVREIVQHAAELGFDGFVLTGLDTISQDAERAACLTVIRALDKAYPDKQLVIEGGLDMVAETRRELEGVLFLGHAHTAEHLDPRIREVKRLGVQALVVDTAPPDISQAEIAERTQHFRSVGAVPFFTTSDLTGIHLGPLQEVIRRVVVIHSGPARETFTAKVLHGSLEWLGYQVHYVDGTATEQPTWKQEIARVSAVILDATLRPLPQQQAALLALTDHLQTQRIPLLLTGVPWGSREEFAGWADRLGLRGSGDSLPVEKASLRVIEHAWLQESGAIRPRIRGFRDLQAPTDARVLSSVKADTVFDQVFLTSWGGVWMDALATSVGPQLKPLPFLESWLGQTSPAPVMDVASQNGRRLLVPQISSEGFTTATSLPGLPIAAEAMTDRILSRYSLPFTVAVCEGDLRGSNPGLDPRDALRYETAARALFALPQVHAACASRTRPQDWQTCPDMPREIAGAMAYIHRQLLPTGRQVELMLWPQNAQPTPAAVAFSRQMGVENVQPLTPDTWLGHATVPAASTWGRAETHATLTTAPRRTSTLSATPFITEVTAQGAGRWMSPMHVALRFDDALSEAGLWEVERVLDWCAAQPLHAMSSADHAKLVRDAAQTRLFEQRPGHWILVNAGHARTLRLPASSGLPDLDRSVGIAGYTVRGEDLYIHTLGRRRTELVLSPQGSPTHLRLAVSSGQVRYLEAGQQRALLQVADLRPVEMTFEGIPPGATCQIFTTEQPQFLMADPQGRVEVTVPAQTTIRLQVLPTQQAAMR